MATANPEYDLPAEKWSALKTDVKKTWSRLTDEELDLVNGDFAALENLIRQKYGLTPADTRAKLEELKASFRRDLKQESEAEQPPAVGERDGVRGTLRDQYRQF